MLMLIVFCLGPYPLLPSGRAGRALEVDGGTDGCQRLRVRRQPPWWVSARAGNKTRRRRGKQPKAQRAACIALQNGGLAAATSGTRIQTTTKHTYAFTHATNARTHLLLFSSAHTRPFTRACMLCCTERSRRHHVCSQPARLPPGPRAERDHTRCKIHLRVCERATTTVCAAGFTAGARIKGSARLLYYR
jgi:hypothetical protein